MSLTPQTTLTTTLATSYDDITTQDTLVVFADSNHTALSSLLTTTDKNTLSELATAANFSGQLGETFTSVQTTLENASVKRILLIGTGDITSLSAGKLQKLATSTYKALQNQSKQAFVLVDGLSDNAGFSQFSLALLNASYQFDIYKTKKRSATQNSTALSQVTLCSPEATTLQDELNYASAVHQGQSLARFVGNQPGNVCFPMYMTEQAQALAAEFPDLLTVHALGEADMEKLGMGCFLSVSKGSEREGQLITLEYKGPKATQEKPVVLVGKGVTFDTGGISIKPGASMDEMKFDMCGSASVLGTMRALCEAKLPINVVGALACAENMPSAGATRPGDIVTSMSGQTVEILNTDAEGRLVLCDTLTYIGKYDPDVVVDIATLTGACVIALGHVMTGLFSQDDALATELLTASQTAHDRAWRMPLDDDYQELLDSSCADIQNIGGRPAGSVTAACYLSRFTGDYRWAHLDIAGSAWVSGKNKGATGRPVPMLMQFLRNRVSQS